jgi:hypothetical protein
MHLRMQACVSWIERLYVCGAGDFTFDSLQLLYMSPLWSIFLFLNWVRLFLPDCFLTTSVCVSVCVSVRRCVCGGALRDGSL